MLRASWPVFGWLLAFATLARAETPLLDLAGNSWERGIYAHPSTRPFDDDRPASGLRDRPSGPQRTMSAVGELTAVAAPLVWNPQAFSISWHLRDLELVSDRRHDTARVSRYDRGRITFYADLPSVTPSYGTYPPNETAPADFADGFSVYLDGLVTNLELAFDETEGTGEIRGAVTFVGGDAFPLLSDPGNWELVAEIRRGGPVGYAFRLSGGVAKDGIPTAVEPESWTGVKGRYR